MQLHNRSLILSARLTEFLALCSKHHQVNDVSVLAHLSISKICLHKIELTESCLFFFTIFSIPNEGVSCLTWRHWIRRSFLTSYCNHCSFCKLFRFTYSQYHLAQFFLHLYLYCNNKCHPCSSKNNPEKRLQLIIIHYCSEERLET